KIKEIAEFVVKNIFVTYSEKQWGTTIDKLDPNTMARVPVYTSYEDRYFTDTYQFQPKEGYTKLFENILNHKNIKVLLNTQAKDVLEVKNNQVYYNGEAFDGYVVFTGPIDEFFDNKFGKLPYRSLRFDFETHQEESYQPAAVVNYTVDQDYTRISEFKKFTTENPPKDNTVIVKEYSLEYKQNEGMIPYYPIINEENSAMFEQYKNYCQGIKNFYLLGRLGNYKYINMDMAVKLALELAEEIKNKENGR
ncbi:MAG: UDP-galactopyranose mutase, partial [Clostridia bacterium]|nr:UDP-galactopyranose mutase [Clostridia bacterium]